MRILSKISFVLFALLFAGRPVFAQQATINISAFNGAHSFSQNTILCLFKDRYGLMWFGTMDGLNRYDGYGMVVYKHRNDDPGSLPANHISAICEDSAGNLWIGTTTQGILKFDRNLPSFNFYKALEQATKTAYDLVIMDV